VITVRRTEDGKLILVDGLHRLRAIESLGRTHIRAEIMEGGDIEARLWEIAGLLHRANLTALEEAERLAEWVRLTEARVPVSGQKVQKSGRAKVVFLVRIVRVTKIVEHRDGFDDPLDGLGAKDRHAWRDDRRSAGEMLAQLIVQRPNARSLRVHDWTSSLVGWV
jgi:ParB-like chromosome segregation protein Spo0J